MDNFKDINNVYCIMLRSANSLTNVKTDINSITDFQNMSEYNNNKEHLFASLKVTYLAVRENSHLMHRSPFENIRADD